MTSARLTFSLTIMSQVLPKESLPAMFFLQLRQGPVVEDEETKTFQIVLVSEPHAGTRQFFLACRTTWVFEHHPISSLMTANDLEER